MHWISRLSLSRAVLMAAAWPIMLTILPTSFVGLGRAYGAWTRWRSGGTDHFFVRARILHWPALILVAFVPPIAFLIAWALSRFVFVDPAA